MANSFWQADLDTDSDLPNYDPTLIPHPVGRKYLNIRWYSDEGATIDLFIMPASFLETDPFNGILHASSICNRAVQAIDIQKATSEGNIKQAADLVAEMAATIISINIGVIFAKRFPYSDLYGFTATSESEEQPTTAEEKLRFAARVGTDHVADKLKPMIESALLEHKWVSFRAWRFAFSAILFEIERDHGALESLQGEELERLFNEYHTREAGDLLAMAYYALAEEAARDYLESNGPNGWTAEELAEFLGYTIDSDPATREIVDLHIRQLERIIEKLKAGGQEQVKMGYLYRKDKLILSPEFEIDASEFDLTKLLEPKAMREREDHITKKNFRARAMRRIERYATQYQGELQKGLFAPIVGVSEKTLAKYLKRDGELWDDLQDKLDLLRGENRKDKAR